MRTLSDLTTAYDFGVLEHLEHDAEVPVNDGLQAQGDVYVIPAAMTEVAGRPGKPAPVGPEGVAVVAAAEGGHEHRLFAGSPGTASWAPVGAGQDVGLLECTEPAYLLHPEHGATGIAPGSYLLRRQREQADEERLVAD